MPNPVDTIWSQRTLPFADLSVTTDEPGRAWWSQLAGVEESAWVGRARHAFLDGRTGAARTRTGRLVPGSVTWREPASARDWLRHLPSASRLRRPAVSLRDPGMESNWYHLLLDLLGGRLRLADLVLGRDLAVIISDDLPPQAHELLGRAHLSEREWIMQPSDGWLRVDELVIAHPPRHHPDAVRYLWDELEVPVADHAANDRLFVAREPASGRQVANESEVQDLIGRYGLSVIRPWELSLDEQMERFGRASLVVGVHGAGLTGVLWRREAPVTLIDIQVDGRVQPMRPFAYLTASVGGRYLALGADLWATDTPALDLRQQPWKRESVRIDCAGLSAAIESTIEG